MCGQGVTGTADAGVVSRSSRYRGANAVCFSLCVEDDFRVAFEAMEGAAYGLDQSMGDVVGGLEVLWWTNNVAFEEYEENVPSQALSSPLYIFAHERHVLRQLVARDPFDDLSAVELPAKI